MPEGYDHSPFMILGDTSPGTKGMSAAAHEASEGGGYLVIVLAGEEAMDPVVVSELRSLLELLGKLAPIVSASQKRKDCQRTFSPTIPLFVRRIGRGNPPF